MPGFYHSDRPLTQQALARALSYSLVPSLPRSTVHRFLRAFWITIGRNFHSLDRLRLDKYLFLIRCYVGVSFEIFVKGHSHSGSSEANSDKKRKREDSAKMGRGKRVKNQDESEAVAADEENEEDEDEDESDAKGNWADLSAYISIIEEGPLCPVNFDPDQSSKPVTDANDPNSVPMPHGPDGLRYHLIDIWVDELEKVLEFEDEEENEDAAISGDEEDTVRTRKIKGHVPMELILRPLEKLCTESPYKPVRMRAAEALDDDRLFEWGVRTRDREEDEDENEDDEEEWGGFAD